MKKPSSLRALPTLALLALLGGTFHGTATAGPPPDDDWQVPAPPEPTKLLAVPVQPFLPTSAASAYLAGSASVPPSGEFRYQIPLAIPPGPAGLQPDLSIAYSSRSGDGYLGVGWQLSGLSEIHRCGRIHAIDGVAAGVNYDDLNDAICIDGNRLIPTTTEGLTQYYTTEQETFARVRSEAKQEGPDQNRTFTVEAKDGRELRYEPLVLEDYPGEGDRRDLAWPLREIRDRSGNTIELKYAFEQETEKGDDPTSRKLVSYRIESIGYSDRLIDFAYDPRPLPTVSWDKAIGRRVDRMLGLIRISSPTHQNFATYDLHTSLSTITSRPLLRKLEYCSHGTCTQPKEFEYDETTAAFSAAEFEHIPQPFVYDANLEADFAVADIDGNGQDDIVYPMGLGVTYHGTGLAHNRFITKSNGELDLVTGTWGTHLAPNVTIPIDRQGDGSVEVIVVSGNPVMLTDHYQLLRWQDQSNNFELDPTFPFVPFMWKGQPWAASLDLVGFIADVYASQSPYFVDLDGDGLAEMVQSQFGFDANGAIVNEQLLLSANQAGVLQPQQNVTGLVDSFVAKKLGYRGGVALDYRRDGRSVLLLSDAKNPPEHAAIIFKQEADGTLAFGNTSHCVEVAASQYEVLLDVNADGLEDRLCVRAEGFAGVPAEACVNHAGGIWSDCEGVTFVPPLDPGIDDGWTRFLPVDINADGLDDLVIWQQQQPGRILVYRAFPAAGGFAFALQEEHQYPDGLQSAHLGDFDGDGRTDIAAIHGAASIVGPKLQVLFQNERFDDLLTTVREQGNARDSDVVAYAPWQPATGDVFPCTYPVRCLRPGDVTVVAWHRRLEPGIHPGDESRAQATHYRYHGPRADAHGRGFLGFAEVETWEPQRPAYTVTKFRSDLAVVQGGRLIYPEAGVPESTTVVVPMMDVPVEGRKPYSGVTNKPQARVIETKHFYQTEWTAQDFSYWTHPTGWITKEWEEEVCIEWNDFDNFANGNVGCVALPEVAKRVRQATIEYDAFGNNTRYRIDTVGGSSSETYTEYENRIDTWLLGLPVLQLIKSARSNAFPMQQREVRLEHDDDGRLWRLRLEPFAADPDLKRTIEYKYDDRGRMRGRRAEAPGAATSYSFAHFPDGAAQPDVTWNGLGHASWFVNDDSLGVALATLEGVKRATHQYDGLARPRSVNPEVGATTDYAYALVVDGNGGYVGTATTTTSDAGDEATIVADELGQVMSTSTLAFDGADMVVAQTFDLLGRKRRQSRPGKNAPDAFGFEWAYDSLDRLTRTTTPDGVATDVEHEFQRTTTISPKRAGIKQATRVERDLDDHVVKSTSYDSAWPTQNPGLETTYKWVEFDKVQRITDPLGNETVMTYDRRGRRKTLDDPDAGFSESFYDGHGNLRRLETTEYVRSYDHDAAGRVLSVDSDVDGVTKFTWDHLDGSSSPNSVGQLVRTESPFGVAREYGHDSYGRLEHFEWQLAGEKLRFDVDYDNSGRASRLSYPDMLPTGRVSVGFGYTASNHLERAYDADVGPTRMHYRVDSRHPDGSLHEWTLGATNSPLGSTYALRGKRTQYPKHGRLERTVATSPGNGTPVADIAYQYFIDGALKSRVDTPGLRSDSYDYDLLDRLDYWKWSHIGPQIGATHSTEYGYDDIGNLTDVTVDGSLSETLFYTNARPHAVDSSVVGSTPDTFHYDGVGRQDESNRRAKVTYTSFDLPRSIETAAGVATFDYDASQQRIVKSRGLEQEVTLGSLYMRRTRSDLSQEHVFRVPTPDGAFVELVYDTAAPGGGLQSRYMVADGLGSPALAANVLGALQERMFFDPFGRRTKPLGGETAPATSAIGFTSHQEDIDEGLINMKGRVYDPRLRRFLTPDPVVTDPLSEQSFNRYSYVDNNPTNLVDPTGFQEGNPGGGGTGPDGGASDPGAGECVGNGCYEGLVPLSNNALTARMKSDAQGYDPGGCPESQGGWASGPCPLGVVAAGCAGGADHGIIADGRIALETLGNEITSIAVPFARAAGRRFVAYLPIVPKGALRGLTVGGAARAVGQHAINTHPIASIVRSTATRAVDAYHIVEAVATGDGDKIISTLGEAAGETGGQVMQSVVGIATLGRGSESRATGGTPTGVGAWPADAAFFNTNWKSVPTYGHTFLRHGQGSRLTRNLAGEAMGSGVPQGQWLNNQAAAEIIAGHHPYLTGPATVPIPTGVGQVILPTGQIVPATRAVLVPNGAGFRTAYPVQ